MAGSEFVGVTEDFLVGKKLITEWTSAATIPGVVTELSDVTAVLLACGYLPEPARQAIVARIDNGMPIPTSGGFSALRRQQAELAELERVQMAGVADGQSSALSARRLRARYLRKKIIDARKSVIEIPFASSVKDIRRERAAGVYVEIADREMLFSGLTWTPTPNVEANPLKQLGKLAASRIVGRVGQLGDKFGSVDIEEWLKIRSRGYTAALDDSHFIDAYETALYLVGFYYERIVGSTAWHSEHFSLQRKQIHLSGEIVGIAVDLVKLRTVRMEIDLMATHNKDASTKQFVNSRISALVPVWKQVMDRIAALVDIADSLRRADERLFSFHHQVHPGGIDERIDDLIGGSGEREISADNARLLAIQVQQEQQHWWNNGKE